MRFCLTYIHPQRKIYKERERERSHATIWIFIRLFISIVFLRAFLVKKVSFFELEREFGETILDISIRRIRREAQGVED